MTIIASTGLQSHDFISMNGVDKRRPWYAIGCGLLLLVILLPLNAAGTEIQPRRAMSNIPACISIVRIAKNIIIGHATKQEAVVAGHYERNMTLLGNVLIHGKSCLSWPYCGYSRKWVRGAPSKHGIFGLVQSPMQRPSIDNDAVMWRSGGGKSVILEMVTEDGMWSSWGTGQIALGILGCQYEAVKNRADVGSELPVFAVSRNINRVRPSSHDQGSEERIRDSSNGCPSSPFQASFIMLAALSLGSLVAAFKGVYRDSDVLIFGGTAVAIISGSALMVWVLSHLPLAILFLPSPPSCHMMLSDFSGLFPRA